MERLDGVCGGRPRSRVIEVLAEGGLGSVGGFSHVVWPAEPPDVPGELALGEAVRVTSLDPLGAVAGTKPRSAREGKCRDHPQAKLVFVKGRGWFCSEAGCPSFLGR